MKEYSSDGDHWVALGRAAAAAGRTNEAVSAAVLLGGYLLTAVSIIIENQIDIYNEIQTLKAITRSNATQEAAHHKRWP
jgi:hypothetical protein